MLLDLQLEFSVREVLIYILTLPTFQSSEVGELGLLLAMNYFAYVSGKWSLPRGRESRLSYLRIRQKLGLRIP